jgi:transposase
MENVEKVIMGIDVSSDKLDWWIHDHKARGCKTVTNSKSGHRKIYNTVKRHGVTAVVLEASGGYEQQVSFFLVSQHITVHVVNPIRIRAFAKSKGVLAKTDKIDAKVIAEFGALYDLPEYQLACKEFIRLRALARLYMQLQKDLNRSSNRNRIHQDKFIRNTHNRIIRSIKNSMDSTVKEMAHICNELPLLSSMCQTITDQKGMGLKSAMLLIALLPELGHLTGKKIACLAGLAPFANDSGKFKGKRYVQGGRFYARKVLYMPVLVAKEYDCEFKRLYEDRLSKGKEPKVALTSLMRKLLVRLNARIRDMMLKQYPDLMTS